MRHRFHQTEVDGECAFDQLLAVAGDGTSADRQLVTELVIDLGQLFLNDLHGITLVGAVVGVDDIAALGDDDQLGRRGAAVDADIRVAGIAAGVFGLDAVLRVAADERLIFVFILEERRQGRDPLLVLHALLEALYQLVIAHQLAVLGVQRRADRHSVQSVAGEDRVLFTEL